MPTYKLTYFNFPGYAEPIRFLFNNCGIKFEDIRITHDEWPKHKPNMPMGQVPILEIDGKKYHQSKAIARFVAKKCNMYGSNDCEAMEIDMICDTISDLLQALTYHWEKDPAFKAIRKKTADEKLPFYMDRLEDQVKKNGGYFVGGKLSWADITWAAFYELLCMVLGEEPLKGHPELKKLTEKVRALPNIKAYIEKRPKAEH